MVNEDVDFKDSIYHLPFTIYHQTTYAKSTQTA